jgi:hypothetical protein
LRQRWLVLAAVALGASVLTKYVPLLFAAPFFVYAIRARLVTRRAAALSILAAIGLAVAAWAPFWAGAAGFAALREAAYPQEIASTSGVIVSLIPDNVWLFRSLRVVLAMATLAIVLLMTLTRTRTIDDLLRACAVIALGYLFVSSPLFWAWYLLLPIALLAPTRNLALLVVVTAGSRLVAPLDLVRLQHVISWTAEMWLTTVVALWMPLAFAIWQYVARGEPQTAATRVRETVVTLLPAFQRASS